MREKRILVTAIPMLLLALSVGAALYFGFLNNQAPASSNAGTETPATFHLAGGKLVIDITDAENSGFEISAKFNSVDGSIEATLIEPNVSMAMVGHSMGRTPVQMMRHADGTWKGRGRFSMGGQWRFRIVFDNETVHLDQIAR
ncbi:hypothetical protein [Natronohydrobacter thiooxidans]|uniref:hypothetical protein n=1 Tax=Natronohydrobacter thiooxidans TaxID=87172 RepID=UPI0008FF0652|nr:hypothetical protein [Natronohydrobacter thiooxidans]